MDDVDLRIAECLGEDGRMPNSEIARRLGVSEGTVRARLKRLIDDGTLKVQALANADAVRNLYPVLIGLKLEGRQLERFAERLQEFPEVQRAMIVSGRYDILVSIVLDSHDRLVDFMSRKLWKLPGIRDTETFLCLGNTDPWFPVSCLSSAAAPKPKAPPKARTRSRKDA